MAEQARQNKQESKEATVDRLKREHTPDAIAERLQSATEHSYLGDFIYGAIDGAVTTFAVVAGVQGAGLAAGVIVILGMANLIADGFSMAVSNFLGSRAEEQLRQRARRKEQRHIALNPDGEREEIRQIYAAKGLEGDDLERVVEAITSDQDRWVDTMMQQELGLQLEGPNALRAALSTFTAFVVVGFLPIGPFIYQFLPFADLSDPFLVSAIMTGVAFFLVGVGKSRVVEQRWWIAGLETLAVGGAAAVMAYVVGWLLRGVGSAA